MATLEEFISSQQNLIQEASEAVPHQFSRCTYTLGPVRQAVYLCLTCPEKRGLCSACSVACHTNHEQVELFPKRNFRCDCPTAAVAHPCSLHRTPEPENESNTYNQNFSNQFCRCGRPYDATKERETMIQCLACEDWFHESCCNLREKPTTRAPTPEPSREPDEQNADAVSVASSSGLPPPLITADDYESLVCASCVEKIPFLKRWAGTPGVLMVIREDTSSPWVALKSDSDTTDGIDIVVSDSSPVVGAKRSRSASPSDTREPKRSRVETSSPLNNDGRSVCLAPKPNNNAQAALQDRDLSAGDLFFKDNFRERWCRCNSCLPLLEPYSYLLKEEDTYEHPEDPDSGLSLEELGMRALLRLPRDRAIEGIHAFNALRDKLMQYLRPFAQEGKIVNEADIQSFFDQLKDAQNAQTASSY